jgi:hypothetical protein
VSANRRGQAAAAQVFQEMAERVGAFVRCMVGIHRFIRDGIFQHMRDIGARFAERDLFDPVHPFRPARLARIAA